MLERTQQSAGAAAPCGQDGCGQDGTLAEADDGPPPRLSDFAARIFSRTLEQEIPFLHRSARRWHRDHADAEDLLQDTLVRAWASAHLWRPGSNLRAWLVTIMRNQFFASLERSARSDPRLHGDFQGELVAPARQEAGLELRELASAIGRLPEKQRSAILLVAVEEKSYQEVAEAMQTSIDAVRCPLARGRARLREIVRAKPDRSPLAAAKRRNLAAARRCGL